MKNSIKWMIWLMLFALWAPLPFMPFVFIHSGLESAVLIGAWPLGLFVCHNYLSRYKTSLSNNMIRSLREIYG